MSGAVELRRLRRGHAAGPSRLLLERALAALHRTTWSPAVAPMPLWGADVDFFTKDGPADVIGEGVIGHVKLRRPTDLDSYSHVLQVGGLAVAPAHQGRGVGRSLVPAAVQEARRRGAARLTLHLLGTNPAARHLYAACGLEVEGVLREDFELGGQMVDDVLRALSLH